MQSDETKFLHLDYDLPRFMPKLQNCKLHSETGKSRLSFAGLWKVETQIRHIFDIMKE